MYKLLNKIKNKVAKFKNKDIFLYDYEKRYYSQHGEDGVIEKIFQEIHITNRYYVEFGVENGSECNTRFFREQHQFNGLLMDGGNENDAINLKQEFITAENINELFEKYNVPESFDLLSIDIDYNDFWVLNALSPKYKPRVIVAEVNTSTPPNEDKIVPYNPFTVWDGSRYFGASLLAMTRLAQTKGYELVYVESTGTNAFYVKKDILDNLKVKFQHQGNINKCYRYPTYGPLFFKGHPKSPKRHYVSSNIPD
ncbi:hypothetical protein DID73_01310 [Candidatus Marinamargulisbacteria bacterium SCGC AG-343-K17]|nr:hypothetical protein DID73_01310 [Candidatus Marinamargulisbacteria bacterium SCGC AG-343-K17]